MGARSFVHSVRFVHFVSIRAFFVDLCILGSKFGERINYNRFRLEENERFI